MIITFNYKLQLLLLFTGIVFQIVRLESDPNITQGKELQMARWKTNHTGSKVFQRAYGGQQPGDGGEHFIDLTERLSRSADPQSLRHRLNGRGNGMWSLMRQRARWIPISSGSNPLKPVNFSLQRLWKLGQYHRQSEEELKPVSRRINLTLGDKVVKKNEMPDKLSAVSVLQNPPPQLPPTNPSWLC